MKRITIIAAMLLGVAAFAQNQTAGGGISEDLLKEISKGYEGTAADKALHNAINADQIDILALQPDNITKTDRHFSHEVATKGRTNQKSSGRCWLFTGLNVLRSKMIAQYNLGAFTFSQNYLFFYDQLEKANLFLQGIIDTKDLADDDRQVDWFFAHPIGDGGQFTGVSNLVTKYGVVPSEVMPETLSSNYTSQMRTQLSKLLRQDGLRLRQAWANASSKERKNGKAEKALQEMKVAMLKDVYHVLGLCLGVPPTEFTWARYDASGKFVDEQTYTPKSFYQQYIGADLENNYVMVMNDPSREYNKVYEIQYDRHVYDGHNWVYVNLPIERIKEMAIASIKDNTALYFSCDVGKFLSRQDGIADMNNFDYESLLGIKFTMDKKERIQTHASGSTHAMTLIAVDIKNDKPVKWMVENSWGDTGKGNIIMTDDWFNEYMFRLVVEKKYVPEDVLKLLKEKPIQLPAWDPMFLPEE